MSIIDSILQDELSRLEALRRKYEAEWSVLPSGSLSKKRRANKVYFYRAHREGDRVIQSYVGRDDDPRVRDLHQLVQKRQKYEKDLRTIAHDIIRIRKMLNVR